MSNLSKNTCFFVAGHRGMVGSAIVRKLHENGFHNIITRSHAELDLTDQSAVREFFKQESIDYVVLAAAKVGGIYANNTYPADFIYINLMIEANVINEAFVSGVRHLLFLGSSCIYPKLAPQPMREEHLLSSPLEPTNEPYAIAKIAGIKLCESYNRQYGCHYRSVMPTNLYGPCDNFHLENSHVLPALIRKFHIAKLAMEGKIDEIQRDVDTFGQIPDRIKNLLGFQQGNDKLSFMENRTEPVVEIWGSGKALREFLHVDDLASACLFIMELTDEAFNTINASADPISIPPSLRRPSFINVGTGKDITIEELAKIIKNIVGFKGSVVYNEEKPDGTPRKLLDTSKINSLGWTPSFDLKEGIENVYKWYCELTLNSSLT